MSSHLLAQTNCDSIHTIAWIKKVDKSFERFIIAAYFGLECHIIQLLATGHWLLAAGSWLSATGHRLLASSQKREASG
jgi:hypothetical protein